MIGLGTSKKPKALPAETASLGAPATSMNSSPCPRG